MPTTSLVNKKKFYFLPVFVIKNFQGMAYSTERVIHYPWFTDRHGDHWAIVHEERVFEVPADERGDILNILKPALMLVDTFEVKGGLAGHLRDIDGKYIVRPAGEFWHMTIAELDNKLHGADTSWVEQTYGRARQNQELPQGEVKVSIDLKSGLLRILPS